MGQETVCRDVWHGSPREALLKIGVDVFGAVGQTSQIGTPTLRQAFGVPGGAVSEQHGAFPPAGAGHPFHAKWLALGGWVLELAGQDQRAPGTAGGGDLLNCGASRCDACISPESDAVLQQGYSWCVRPRRCTLASSSTSYRH